MLLEIMCVYVGMDVYAVVSNCIVIDVYVCHIYTNTSRSYC